MALTYIQYVLDHIGEADTQEKLDALLPWNVDLVPFLKNVSQYG
ncbi:transposase domain-containing protein [Brenneria uluponensis]|nr:transposase domain-containing protein [Brenneria ulupoensis]